MAGAFQLSTARDASAWDAFVQSRPDATGYHEWAWRSVIERAFGHQCHYLVAEAGGAIAGVLPIVEIRSLLFGRSMTSLPFLNYGGVLAASDEAARTLAGEAARLATARGCKHVEFRHIGRHFDDLPCKQHKVTMRLALAEGLWERLDRKARNQVRKAQKSELTVERGGAELVEAFYRVFARNMRDLGTPVMPRRFFDEVIHAFGDRIRIIVVRLKDQPIAAGLTYRTGGLIEIPWASSVRDFNSLCPNHLLYWHALETAIAEGVKVFDFGRSTPGEGTFKFKEQWGAEPVPLHWEYWVAKGGDVPDQSPKNPKFHLAIEAWKRLPLWAANAVGPRLVRGIP
jgi:FemAB-related protein (PEP-CTERM system-associated)